ncbi:unnamed protein product [Kluyveromyces dobzhanskii CBS 2104]|uniref:WGS project CCBQ000000000 data, contig 00015 n=1 Tax=Kluyveromyces dobzhanskii CBS 2104 TaxID=1427455 RepID=A0A0A8L9P2_9SACH|nr:unnamed protein product [Kluyveromyces dobzhanskii CBS 2104]
MNTVFWLLCPALFATSYLLPVTSGTVDKDGILNVYFVKFGWFWTSVISCLCVLRYSNPLRHWKRYALLTGWWIIFTQEVLGITPVMDLIFLNSGGSCSFEIFDPNGKEPMLNLNFHDNEFRRLRGVQRMLKWLTGTNASKMLITALNSIVRKDGIEYNQDVISELKALSNLVKSSKSCTYAGGHWTGGHDPSGHIFLITLMLMLMFGELSLYQNRAFKHLKQTSERFCNRVGSKLLNLFDNSALANLWIDDNNSQWWFKFFFQPPLSCYRTLTSLTYLIVRFVAWDNPIILLFVFTMLWSYSFVVTVTLFHTFWEQLSGFVAAYSVSVLVYQFF